MIQILYSKKNYRKEIGKFSNYNATNYFQGKPYQRCLLKLGDFKLILLYINLFRSLKDFFFVIHEADFTLGFLKNFLKFYALTYKKDYLVDVLSQPTETFTISLSL